MSSMIVDLNSFNKFFVEQEKIMNLFCVYGIDDHQKYLFADFEDELDANEYIHDILIALLDKDHVPTEIFWYNDPKFKEKILRKIPSRPECKIEIEKIKEVWPEIIGPKFNSMTRVISFEHDILTIFCANTTLLSLLNQYEKPKILSKFKTCLPTVNIEEILFKYKIEKK